MQMPEPTVSTRRSARGSGFASRGARRVVEWVAVGSLSLFFLAAIKAQDWPMFRGSPQFTGTAQSPIRLPLSLSWRYVTGHAIPGTNPSTPIFVSGLGANPVTFFAARDLIASLRLDTGEARWFYPSSGALGGQRPATVRITPLYSNGILYVGATNGSLYALQPNTGEVLWEYLGESAITGSPIEVDGRILFGTTNGGIVALDAKTGKPVMNPAELFRADDAILGSLAYSSGFLFFVSRDQSVYALDVAKALAPRVSRRTPRVIRWRYQLSAPPSYASPVVYRDSVYVVDGESLLHLNVSRGRRRWSYQAERQISNTPAVTEQGIFFGTRDGTFIALSLEGRLRWKTELAGPPYSSPIVAAISMIGAPPSSGSLTAANGAAGDENGAPGDGASADSRTRHAVFVGSNRGFLYAFDVGRDNPPDETARPLWIYKVRPADPLATTTVNFVASPVIYNNQLYALADDGSLLAFHPDAADRTPPLVWGEAPSRSQELSGRPPITYMVTVADDGSGIDPDSIVMRVDNQKVEHVYDEYRGLIYHKVSAAAAGSREAVQPLPSGRHSVYVEVADWRGNKTVREWSFPVNNNIVDPRRIFTAPG